MKDQLKDHFYAKADVVGGSPVFLLLGAAAVLLGAVFFIRQLALLPPDADTLKILMLDEGKDKANPYKKYFPKPYSVDDLARGDAHDRP